MGATAGSLELEDLLMESTGVARCTINATRTSTVRSTRCTSSRTTGNATINNLFARWKTTTLRTSSSTDALPGSASVIDNLRCACVGTPVLEDALSADHLPSGYCKTYSCSNSPQNIIFKQCPKQRMY